MAPLDMSSSLPDLSEDAPAGPNLEFDPDFAELERLAQGKPEQQYGAKIIPAEDPDWKGTVAKARSLLERTYDLRVLAHLAVARLQLEGIGGFAQTVSMIREVLDTRWAAVHPQLDPEDDNDPTLRANALLRITDPLRVLRVLRDLPLARSLRAGSVCWRDIAISTGVMDPEPGKPKMGEPVIVAAFRESDPAGIDSLRAAIASISADVVAIPAVFDRETGYGNGPELEPLAKLLKDIGRAVTKYAPEVVAEADPEPEPTGEPEVADALAELNNATPRAGTGGVSIAAIKSVTTRADALRLLDLIVQYYEQYEPSSPVQMVIRRARRLADKSFIDVLRDLAPDGVNQAELIAGKPEA